MALTRASQAALHRSALCLCRVAGYPMRARKAKGTQAAAASRHANAFLSSPQERHTASPSARASTHAPSAVRARSPGIQRAPFQPAPVRSAKAQKGFRRKRRALRLATHRSSPDPAGNAQHKQLAMPRTPQTANKFTTRDGSLAPPWQDATQTRCRPLQAANLQKHEATLCTPRRAKRKTTFAPRNSGETYTPRMRSGGRTSLHTFPIPETTGALNCPCRRAKFRHNKHVLTRGGQKPRFKHPLLSSERWGVRCGIQLTHALRSFSGTLLCQRRLNPNQEVEFHHHR